MSRFIPAVLMSIGVAFGAGCAHSSHMPEEGGPVRTVLKVENQGFPDMNVFVLPQYLLRGTCELRFQALPIATPRGPVSQSIVVTPGDTVVLTIPPSA